MICLCSLWTCFSCLVISPLVIFHLLPLSSSSPHHLRSSAPPARFAHRLQTLDDQTLAVASWTPTATTSPTTLALPSRPCAPPPDFDPVELQGFAASHPAISTLVAPLLPTSTSCQASLNPLFHLQTRASPPFCRSRPSELLLSSSGPVLRNSPQRSRAEDVITLYSWASLCPSPCLWLDLRRPFAEGFGHLMRNSVVTTLQVVFGLDKDCMRSDSLSIGESWCL